MRLKHPEATGDYKSVRGFGPFGPSPDCLRQFVHNGNVSGNSP